MPYIFKRKHFAIIETESTEEKPANAAIDVENVSDATNDTNDAIEPDVDINAMVQRIEAKCANVREELGRMAVSEQYMRTKQAQLVRTGFPVSFCLFSSFSHSNSNDKYTI